MVKLVEAIERMLIATVAMISLFASTATACNCSHHDQPSTDEAILCHAHTPVNATSEIANASSKSLQCPCECILVKPTPAVIAKSDKKIFQPQSEATPVAFSAGSIELGLIACETPPMIARDRSDYLSQRPNGLLPARAPPRL